MWFQVSVIPSLRRKSKLRIEFGISFTSIDLLLTPLENAQMLCIRG